MIAKHKWKHINKTDLKVKQCEDSSGSEQVPTVGSCEPGNETLAPQKAE
jgi:hypothetical protein